jgi:C_GCAxxG_C_C family probable redox protein
MENPVKKKLNPRKVFWQRGTCSNAMFHLLNDEFCNVKPNEEKASDTLAGGIAQKGHQCGMLWGAALAAGNEAYNRYDDKDMAIAAAVNASKLMVDSFHARTNAVNCRDITRVDWENRLQSAMYMLKTIARGFVFSPCFNLIVKWAPEAVDAAITGLWENTSPTQPCTSCATEVVLKMGATEEESMMVAGFAGGIGLSGNGCGALAAAIWYIMLRESKNNPAKKQSMLNNPVVKKVLKSFYTQTDAEMLCKNICNRTFETINEHSDHIRQGGCKNIIEALAKV